MIAHSTSQILFIPNSPTVLQPYFLQQLLLLLILLQIITRIESRVIANNQAIKMTIMQGTNETYTTFSSNFAIL